jgi:hypothetical protein
MKKQLLLLIALWPCLQTMADSIPNAGFEDWIFAGWGVNPRGWNVNNSQILAANIVPDSTSHSGLLAMMLIQSGNFRPEAFCGFPVSAHPSSLDGFFRNQLNSGDTALLRVDVYYQGLPVDSSEKSVAGPPVAGYTSFSLPLNAAGSPADSCVVRFLGGTIYLSMISFDDLSLAFPTGTGQATPAVAWSVFPVPFREAFAVQIANRLEAAGSLELYDGGGHKLLEYALAPGTERIRVPAADLAAGLYHLRLITPSGTAACRLVKQ